MKNTPKLILILAHIILFLHVDAVAQTCTSAGCLDTAFGNGGKVNIPLGNSGGVVIRGGVLLSDGKIVALVSNASLSRSQLVKVNADGSLDTTFGSGGIVDVGWFHPNGIPVAMAIQIVNGEERIVLAGSRPVQQGRTIKYFLRVDLRLPDGSPDTSFGTGGSVLSNAGAAVHLVIQPFDQRIVIVSESNSLTRLNIDGSVDTTFGNNGTAGVPFWGPITMSGSDFLIGGSRRIDQQTVAMAVAKVDSYGSLVSGFGVNGVAAINFGSKWTAQAYSVKVDSVGRVVAAGVVTPFKKPQDIGIVRLSSSGVIDPDFNGTGRLVYDYAARSDEARSIDFQGDGRLLIAGTVGNSTNNDLAVLRIFDNGARDSTFDGDGVAETDILQNDTARNMFIILDPGCSCEKILIVGQSSNGLALARYLIE